MVWLVCLDGLQCHCIAVGYSATSRNAEGYSLLGPSQRTGALQSHIHLLAVILILCVP